MLCVVDCVCVVGVEFVGCGVDCWFCCCCVLGLVGEFVYDGV